MVFRSACREALGAPALAMAATFLAFGAAVQAAGLGIGWGLAAGQLVYGMPGQMVLLAAVNAPGGPLPAVLGAVAANARFLPMAVALAPWLGPRGPARFLALPFIAVTAWAMAMRRLPDIPPADRVTWYLGFALTSWTVAGLSTWLGYAIAPLLDGWILAALLFINPLYFGTILAGETRFAPARRAVLCGAVATPLVLLLPASWALLGAGLVGGTAAFLWGQREKRDAERC
jgi:predicted branched-subunit amino acid permease